MQTFDNINRLPPELGRYFANCHNEEKINLNRLNINWSDFAKAEFKNMYKLKRHSLLKESVNRMKKDGLNNIKYDLIKVEKHPLFTHITVSY